jgi:hypothetical protein
MNDVSPEKVRGFLLAVHAFNHRLGSIRRDSQELQPEKLFEAFRR